MFPPLQPIQYMRKCNAEGQKRSAKGSNVKEDFAPLEVITLLGEFNYFDNLGYLRERKAFFKWANACRHD